MNTLTVSPASTRVSGLAVRAGLALARWGRRRAVRRTDRERILRVLAERSAAREAAEANARTHAAARLMLG
ncbi:hypothetical protein [Agromyces marinus]|uniref:Uncharacterized protein n=1 Tax=Agromyces marinus TaxID=1389020 RepID=A0ABM8GYA3_9MICO|nr:hypothetical protein [Agromyces marinus]UIP58280.1 hypothetical protein DSM26151_11510 [Agromyces marinus]BDZ53474.1 hypothetical protein GCM10025870_05470 [Agromyces marinus]